MGWPASLNQEGLRRCATREACAGFGPSHRVQQDALEAQAGAQLYATRCLDEPALAPAPIGHAGGILAQWQAVHPPYVTRVSFICCVLPAGRYADLVV